MDNTSICDLYRTLKSLKGLEFLLRVGLGRSSHKDKVDLLAACVEGSMRVYAPKIGTLLRNRWSSARLFISDDSIRFDLHGGIGGGIAVCDSTTILEQVRIWTRGENLGGQHRPWAVGYWLPEALCGDLATAESWCDARGIYADMRALLDPYPSAMSHAICRLCVEEITHKMRMIGVSLSEHNHIELFLCLADISAALVRWAFAHNQCYLRGFISLTEQTTMLHTQGLYLCGLARQLLQGEATRAVILQEIRQALAINQDSIL